MKFERFIADIGAAANELGAGADPVPAGSTARWTVRDRSVDVALLAPQNVSVALQTAGAEAVTTWYPIDPALVSVVAQRIARHLVEA